MHFSNICLLYTMTCFVSSTTYQDLQLLQDILFADYSPHLRPVNTSSHPVDISVNISFSKITELDEAHEIMVTWFDLHLTWTDERLVWETSGRYPDVEMMSLPAHKLWTPRLGVLESFDRDEERHDDVIEVFSTGRISWYQRVYSKTPCPLDIVKFPFDKQSCPVTFFIKNAIAAEASIKDLNMNDANHIKNGEWDIKELTAQLVVVSDVQQKRSGFKFNFNLQRDKHYYMYNLLLPMFILIMVNPSAFVIPCTSGERISVAVTLFLSFTIFMSQLRNIIPNSSSGEPWIALFLYVHFHLSADIVIYAIYAPRISDRSLRRYFSWLGPRKATEMKQTTENDLDPIKEDSSKGDDPEIDMERLRYRLDILGVVVYCCTASGLMLWLLYTCLL